MQVMHYELPTRDGYPLAVTSNRPVNPGYTLLINSALGNHQRFFQHFATYAAQRGAHVFHYDYCGIFRRHLPSACRNSNWAGWKGLWASTLLRALHSSTKRHRSEDALRRGRIDHRALHAERRGCVESALRVFLRVVAWTREALCPIVAHGMLNLGIGLVASLHRSGASL